VLQALARTDRRAVVVDAGTVDTVSEVLDRIARALGRLPAVGPGDTATSRAVVGPESADAFSVEARVENLSAADPAVVVLDNLFSAEVAFDLFGRMRDQLWATGHSFLVIAIEEVAGALLTPPADAFFDVRVPVGPMTREEQRDLLARRGVGDIAEWSEAATARTALARARAALRAPGDLAALVQAQQTAAGLGAAASMVFEHIRGLRRPVTAADPDLLAELGLSRATLARALHRLADVGLLQAYSPRDGAPGRPARTYAIADKELEA